MNKHHASKAGKNAAHKAGKEAFQVARLIMQGQVQEARLMAPKRSLTVAEARAIGSACKYARTHYHGCNVSLAEFL